MLFAACVGAGAQILVMVTLIIFLSLLGTFYPGNRGTMYTALVFGYAVTGGIAGKVAGVWYKRMGGADSGWLSCALLTSSLFSLPSFLVFAFVNSVAISWGSSAALPAGTIMLILFTWAIITFPLTVIGASRARSTKPYEAPCKTNLITRAIPSQPWYMQSVVRGLLAGLFPFSAIYIELHYIFASVWGHEVYTLYGILALAFLLLLIVTAACSVALTYFQLAGEDHRWWWRSLLTGGSVGVFIYGYAWFYFFHKSGMDGVLQASFFFGYTLLLSWGFALMTGAVGFWVSHLFVHHIYASIKID